MPLQTKLGNLLEAVPDALVGVDRSGVIRFVNRQTESLFGYDREDLIGASLEMLVPESVREVHAAHRRSFAADPSIRPMGPGLRLTGRRRDGTEFPVDVALSPVSTGDRMLVIAAVRDMGSHGREQEEQRRLDRLAAIVEHSDDAIISSTLDGVITSWNRAGERLYGYTSKEIIGKSDWLLVPRDRADEARAALEKIQAGELVEHQHSSRVRKDGTVVQVSLTASPIRDADDRIVGVSTISRSLTKKEEAYELSRFMIEASLDSMVSISPEGKITDANEATVRLTGVPRDKLIGTSFPDYFTDPAKAEEIHQKVFNEGVAVDYPLTLRHSDGTLTEVLYNASAYRDDSGTVLGVFAAARDVTRQIQDQRKIAHQQALELDRLAELERFQRLTVGRELKMIELKKEIEYLRQFGPADGAEPENQD